MDEEFLKQLHAEMMTVFTESICIVTSALARNLDKKTTVMSLRAQIAAGEELAMHPMALDVARKALLFVEELQ